MPHFQKELLCFSNTKYLQNVYGRTTSATLLSSEKGSDSGPFLRWFFHQLSPPVIFSHQHSKLSTGLPRNSSRFLMECLQKFCRLLQAWRISSRWKTLLELFRKGKRKEGNSNSPTLPLLALHAPSNGQPASQVQTDTTVVLQDR